MADETAPPSPAPEVAPSDGDARPYMQVWAESLSQVLGQVAGSPFLVEYLTAAPAETLPAQETDLRVILVASNIFERSDFPQMVQHIKDRFVQARQWIRGPLDPDGRVEIWATDLENK